MPSRHINGRYENLLTFSPTGTDRYRQSIEWLQYAEAGIISLNFIRENTEGIDPQAMEAEVAREFMEKAERAARAQELVMRSQMEMQAGMAAAQQAQQAPAAAPAPPAEAPAPAAAPAQPMPSTPESAPQPATGRPGRVTLREATRSSRRCVTSGARSTWPGPSCPPAGPTGHRGLRAEPAGQGHAHPGDALRQGGQAAVP